MSDRLKKRLAELGAGGGVADSTYDQTPPEPDDSGMAPLQLERTSLRDRLAAMQAQQGPQPGEPTVTPPQEMTPPVGPTTGDDWSRALANEGVLQERMPSAAELDHVKRLVSDPGYAARNMASTASNYIGGAIGAAGEGLGIAANAGRQAIGAAVPAATHYFATHPDDDVLSQFLGAGREGLTSAATAGLGALGLGKLGQMAGGGADRARMASVNATDKDMRDLGMTPNEFRGMTDDLGLNNSAMPMTRTDKMGRVDAALGNAGRAQDSAIRQANELTPQQPWGANIANDLDANADRVLSGGSPNRNAIRGGMMRAADAAQDADIPDLMALRQYKTARAGEAYNNPLGGLNESAAAKGSLAAADSASQQLDDAIGQAGPALSDAYHGANRDYGNASIVEEMLQRGQGAPGAWGDAGAAGLGALVSGGNPMGAMAGIGARRLAMPYVDDLAANALAGTERNLGFGAENTAAADIAFQEWLRERNR